MSNFTSKTALALACLTVIGTTMASPAFAYPSHRSSTSHQSVATPSAPEVETTSAQAMRGDRPCYTEPSGFHTSIHWDNACSAAQKTERTMGDRAESAQPRFMEPDDFHKNIRFNQ